MTFRVLAGGQNGAGKSTIMCSLHVALCLMGVDSLLIEIDPWSDTHDVILGRKPASLRNARSEVPMQDFADRVDQFASSHRQIVLGDMQGRSQYAHNHLLTDLADYGLLVTRNTVDKDHTVRHRQWPHEWMTLFKEFEIDTIQRVHTLWSGESPTMELPPDTIYLADVDRRLIPYHPSIQKLALNIVEKAQAAG